MHEAKLPGCRWRILPIVAAIACFAEAAPAELICAPTARPIAHAGKIAATRNLIKTGGTLHSLVIFAKFADEAAHLQAPPSYADTLFDPHTPGSLAHFYGTMSFHQFSLAGTVLPRRYHSDNPASYYVSSTQGQGHFGRFVEEVLAQVDRDIDFGEFDNDGPDGVPNSGDDDGWVDYVFIVPRSAPRGFIVGGATGVAGLGMPASYVTRDVSVRGVPIRVGTDRYSGSLSSEGPFSQLVGTMAHEFGHALGLPDLYDLAHERQADDSAGIGRWGLMGWGAHGWAGTDGPTELSAWSREKLGWVGVDNERLFVTATDTSVIVDDIRRGGHIVRVPLPTKSDGVAGVAEEYLLLEYRSRAARFYGRGMPAGGLLIWHIRPQREDNTDETRKLVDLVSADGLYRQTDQRLGDNLDAWSHGSSYQTTNDGNLGDATDPFDGVRFTSFGRHTNPPVDPFHEFSPAARGPVLDMQRAGDAISVDVLLPRWSGRIDSDVHWTNQIIVDGDITVTETGRLTVHRGTEVLLDMDRGGGGRDPDRVEITINGDLSLQPPALSFAAPLFRSLQPGGSWFGIVLSPALDSWVSAPAGAYEIFDSRHGVYTAGSPRLQLAWQVQPAPVAFARAELPSVEVSNDGGDISAGSWVHFMVLQDGNRVTVDSLRIAPIAVGDSRVLTLPWVLPSLPGSYTVQMYVDGVGGTAPASPSSHQIQIIEARNPFTSVDLGGPLSRGNGAGFLDADGDGDLDLYLARYQETDLLFCNEAGRFVDCSQWAGVDGSGASRSFAAGDLDADGDLDLYQVNEGPNALLLNDGTGGFSPTRTIEVNDPAWGRGATFLDIDGDGDLDLLVINAGGPNRLFLQEEESWTESATDWGLAASGYGRGMALSDYDADGDTDVFLANYDGASKLMQNNGSQFIDVTALRGIRGHLGDVAAVFGDHDGDGIVDLFLSNQDGDGLLYQGHQGGFTASDAALGNRTVGAAFVDYDNDGDLDLVTTSLHALSGGDQLYQNQSPGFLAIGDLLGLRQQSAGRGLSFADYDGDGDQDMLVADVVACQLYRNNNSAASWVEFDLRSRDGNSESIGARVELRSAGRVQMRDVQVTQGYGSYRPATIHFGLGKAPRVDQVLVHWPDGSSTNHTNLAANRRITLEQHGIATAISDSHTMVPFDFALDLPYPNPFNSRTTLSFRLDQAGAASLDVYHVGGQRVRRLFSGELPPGAYVKHWDGRDEHGFAAASGVYLLRLSTPEGSISRRLVLLQ
jgi:M6 family metalloprotease-like protein